MPKPTIEAAETPVEETTAPAQTPEVQATDTFAVTDARVNLRGDEEKQGRYNIMLTDQNDINQLEALAKLTGFKAANEAGEYYVSVTMDGRSVMEMRRAGGFKALLVTGELTIVDLRNGKPSGHFIVVPGGVTKASLLNGGRVTGTTVASNGPTRPAIASNGGTGLRSVRR